MKKIPKWVKITSLIIASGVASIAVFSFVVLANAWYPAPNTVVHENKAGVEIQIIRYPALITLIGRDSWPGIKSRITIIKIFDRKNDGPVFRILLRGDVNDTHLTHSGEKLAVVGARLGEQDVLYVLRRVPKKDGKETLELLETSGRLAFVPRDESGYFAYISDNKVVAKYNWNGEIVMQAKLPFQMEASASDFTGGPIFVDNENRLNIKMYDREKNEPFQFIWNLNDNTTKIEKPVGR